jgi:hypothetical protein
MPKRTLKHFLALFALGMLAACGTASGPAAIAPTSRPANTPALSPATAVAPPTAAAPAAPAATQPASTAGPAPEATATEAIPEGLTAEGYHQLGSAEAPVTLVMYSDFL